MSVEITRGCERSDRYRYDFCRCTYANGWAQVDTRQDASYYGTWTNPTTRQIQTYCEGDTCLTSCSTDEEYRAEIDKLVAWNKKAGYWIGIDALCSPSLTTRFTELGMVELLH